MIRIFCSSVFWLADLPQKAELAMGLRPTAFSRIIVWLMVLP
jgi:hypothetical protein